MFTALPMQEYPVTKEAIAFFAAINRVQLLRKEPQKSTCYSEQAKSAGKCRSSTTDRLNNFGQYP